MQLIVKRSRCGCAEDGRAEMAGEACGRCDYVFAPVTLPLRVYNSH